MKKENGVSMITVIITIIIIIIISTMAMNSSTEMIDDAGEAKIGVDKSNDDDEIRSLTTFVKTGIDDRVGIALANGILEVVVESGDSTIEYGSGLYLIPGGDDLDLIKEKSGYTNIKKYKNLTASYIVDYNTQNFVRVEELKFK